MQTPIPDFARFGDQVSRAMREIWLNGYQNGIADAANILQEQDDANAAGEARRNSAEVDDVH